MSQVDVVLLQYALGFCALLMRYLSRPCLACCQRCSGCVYGCLCCLCDRRNNGSRRPGELCSWFFTHAAIRWYWFHMAMQLGFIGREFQVISLIGSWPWEVLVSFCSMCVTYLVVLLEVCHFSSVRNKNVVTKITIDGLLDMLLLPVNIVFFGHLCVRKLRLQGDHHSTQVISTIVESSEIWEAWALWSVLGLFVTVVDVESRQDVERRAFVKPFKNLSLQGVRTWVFMIMVITATRLLTTFLQSSAPSLCFWAFKSCMSCTELYEVNIHLAAAAVNFILCSFALAFVFTFEHTFDSYLRQIGPFWKFWGVKGVVSVTYFQWLVLSYGPFNLGDKRIYLLHCLLMTVEMPLLALIHSSCAYPYGKPWLEYLLLLQQKDMKEEMEGEITGRPSGEAALHAGGEAVEGEVRAASSGDVEQEPSATSSSPPQQVDGALLCLFHLAFWVVGCIAAHRFVVLVLPVQEVSVVGPPIFNKTCTKEGDIWHYLSSNPQLHFHMRNDTLRKHQMPNIGGAWLQLCSHTELDCAPGFIGSAELQCSPKGMYTPKGECTRIRCGQPREVVGHAKLHDFRQIRKWTSDTEIDYECIRGYTGHIKGICGKDGVWRFKGECTEVVCPHPPQVPRAKPLLEPHEITNRTWQAGTSVRYQCEEPFTGTVTATCEDDGSFLVSGRCSRMCPVPPQLPNGIAVYDNTVAEKGFFEGLRVTYQCNPGYGGTLVASCRENGKYSIEGGCKLRCTDLQQFLAAELGDSWKDLIRMNSSENMDLTGTGQADLVPLTCALGLTGQPMAACHRGTWSLLGDPCETFKTPQGCRCKRRWKYCSGFWQNKCILWHGCHSKSKDDSSSWCQVEPNTCGRTTWDVCVGQGGQDDPEVIMDPETRAVLFRVLLVAGAVVLATLAVLWILKLRRGGCGQGRSQSRNTRPESVELQITQTNL